MQRDERQARGTTMLVSYTNFGMSCLSLLSGALCFVYSLLLVVYVMCKCAFACAAAAWAKEGLGSVSGSKGESPQSVRAEPKWLVDRREIVSNLDLHALLDATWRLHCHDLMRH